MNDTWPTTDPTDTDPETDTYMRLREFQEMSQEQSARYREVFECSGKPGSRLQLLYDRIAAWWHVKST